MAADILHEAELILLAAKVKEANQLKEQILIVHQMMRGDIQRPSQYEPGYNTLWDEYRNAIESLRELDPETVDQLKNRVIARVRELEARVNDMCDNRNPGDFDDLKQTLALYEETYDQAVALGWQPHSA